ncbi:MAG: arsenosugar biosynthesis radical SAM protein ArsS [Gammaproteobacteria bacterium]
MRDTREYLIKTTTDFPALRRGALEILQVNLGYKCNQSCVHCHVNAGPSRTEVMTPDTLDAVLQALDHLAIGVLDVTGGAPEMHPQFRELVLAAKRLGVRVIDRCNLTILSEPGYEDLGAFLAEHEIEVVASLPCYLEDNVDRQRGKSVFQQSIAGLRQLNALGYGHPGSERVLNLVYNPQGPVLPPAQVELEAQYREVLQREYGIAFHHLLTLANMPIARFGATLLAKGEFDAYLALLRHSYNAKTLPGLMCRHTLSVDWQGYVYDCDFNQMLNVPLGAAAGEAVHLSALAELVLTGQPIAVADHCFGCTAGQGSSCGGALT